MARASEGPDRSTPSLAGLLCSTGGRIGRQTFWLATIALVALHLLLAIVPVVGAVVALLLLWPFACLTSKRLHDCGRSGWPAWLVALPCAATGVFTAGLGILASDPSRVVDVFALAGLAALLGGMTSVLGMIVLLWAGLAPGDPVANGFGPPEAAPLTIEIVTGRR